MRKILLIAATCVAAVGVSGTAAAQDVNPKYTAEEPKSAAGEMKATGVVMEADQQTGAIKLDDQTFLMPKESGGAAMMPQVGAEVTVFYEEQNGQKMITRIGQAQ